MQFCQRFAINRRIGTMPCSATLCFCKVSLNVWQPDTNSVLPAKCGKAQQILHVILLSSLSKMTQVNSSCHCGRNLHLLAGFLRVTCSLLSSVSSAFSALLLVAVFSGWSRKWSAFPFPFFSGLAWAGLRKIKIFQQIISH